MTEQPTPGGLRQVALFCCALALGFVVPRAQSLQALLELYRAHSPDLLAVQERSRAVSEKAVAATAYPAPEIGLEWGSRAVSPGMSNETMYYGGVSLQQMFMYPGKRGAMSRAENARAQMAAADEQAADRDGALRIAEIYVDLYMMQQRLLLLDSVQQQLLSMQESIRRRLETGMVSQEAVLRIQAELARLQAQQVGLKGDLLAMHAMLAAAVGVDSLTVVPDPIAFGDSLTDLPNLDSLLHQAQSRPEVQSMGAGVRMAGEEAESARLRRMPDVMLGGKYMVMMGPDEWALMLGVKIPVAPWASAETRADQRAAQVSALEAKAREQSMYRMVRQELRAAMVRQTAAAERWRYMRDGQVAAAFHALQSVQTAYAANRSDLGMVLDAVRMLLMSQEDVIMAKADWLHSVVNLEKAAARHPGTWLPEVIAGQE